MAPLFPSWEMRKCLSTHAVLQVRGASLRCRKPRFNEGGRVHNLGSVRSRKSTLIRVNVVQGLCSG